MRRILLSIKPKYAEKILNGTKKWEFRRNVPLHDVESIVFYVSSPVKRVVAEVQVKGQYFHTILTMWRMLQDHEALVGISEDEYFRYFNGCDLAYVFALGKITKFEPYKTLEDFGVSCAPQNFCYLPDKQEAKL
jgi:predicted transcriptional regulator